MQATTCFHDGIPYSALQEADFVIHDPVAFDPANSVFNTDSDGGNTPSIAFSGGVSSPPGGFFLGWAIVTSWRQNPWKPLS
jgi:hypothetical protein